MGGGGRGLPSCGMDGSVVTGVDLMASSSVTQLLLASGIEDGPAGDTGGLGWTNTSALGWRVIAVFARRKISSVRIEVRTLTHWLWAPSVDYNSKRHAISKGTSPRGNRNDAVGTREWCR